MAEPEVTAKERERYARARAQGEARLRDASTVVDAHYDPDGDLIDLKFGGGGSMAIPRAAVPDLRRAPASKLASVVVSPAGDALSWPSLDVDVGTFQDWSSVRSAAAYSQLLQDVVEVGHDRQRRQPPRRRMAPRAAVRESARPLSQAIRSRWSAEIGDGPRRMVTRWLPDPKSNRFCSRKLMRSLGSGPRGRRFKSSRPDQFKIRKRPDFLGNPASLLLIR